jgi:hypothetical protein
VSTLITADWHLSSNPRDAYRHRILRKIAKLARTEWGVTQTFILGDLTEEKDRHRDTLANGVADHVAAFAELGTVIILQGNHDSYTDPDVPFFRFLRHMPQVRWIGNPTTFVCPGIGSTLWLPHTRNYKADWDGIPFENHAFIFAHCTVQGASMGHGGSIASGVPTSAFPRGSRVIAGDVHIPHRVGRVRYVGAPYTIDFGDDYQARVLLIKDGGLKSVPIAGPQKRLLEFEGRKPIDIPDGIMRGDIVKIKCHIARKAVDDYPTIRDGIRMWCYDQGFKVHSIVPKITEHLGTRVVITKKDIKSDEELIREFAKHRDIDDRTLRHGERLL